MHFDEAILLTFQVVSYIVMLLYSLHPPWSSPIVKYRPPSRLGGTNIHAILARRIPWMIEHEGNRRPVCPLQGSMVHEPICRHLWFGPALGRGCSYLSVFFCHFFSFPTPLLHLFFLSSERILNCTVNTDRAWKKQLTVVPDLAVLVLIEVTECHMPVSLLFPPRISGLV